MASPPNILYMTETSEVDKSLLSELQMPKSSQQQINSRTHEQPLNEVCN